MAGGSSAGGSTAGGATAGGATAGGSTAGGSTAGGSTAGGATAGGAPACTPTGPELCTDTLDNDCDAGADCADPKCLGLTCQTGTQNVCTAPNTCACGTYVTSVGTTQSGVRASLLEVAGRPRAFWVNSTAALYAECTSNCGTATPSWSTPVAVGAGYTDRSVRPLLHESGGVLSVLWRSGNFVYHSECAANCTVAASWTTPVDLSLGPNTSHTLGYDALNGLKIAAWETNLIADGGGLVYAECTSGCTAAGANWRPLLELPHDPSGTDLKLSALPDGGLRRIAAHFANDSNVIRYGECEADCLANGWAFVSLTGNAKDPSIVLDAQGLPRVFALNTNTNRLFVYRCTQRPCTVQANWSTTNLMASGHVTSGNYSDGSTFFVTSTVDAGALLLGTESGTTYTTANINLCTGAAARGERPHAYSGANDRLRVLHVAPPGINPSINFLYQAP